MNCSFPLAIDEGLLTSMHACHQGQLCLMLETFMATQHLLEIPTTFICLRGDMPSPAAATS
eukprot:12891429-Prorocentrum_lima.AAC.1